MNQVYNLSDANKDELIASLLESMLANTKLVETLSKEIKRLKTLAQKYVLCPNAECSQEIKDLKEQLQDERQRSIKLQATIELMNKQTEKPKKIVIKKTAMSKLDDYFRENFMEEDEVSVKFVLDIIEEFYYE